MTPKQNKATIIATCTQTIADHCGVPAHHIICSHPRKGAVLQEARALLVRHLHICGMSYLAISRLLKRGMDTIRKLDVAGASYSRGKHHAFMAGLPRIPTTLVLTSSLQPCE
jgi:hypothetical protein